MSGRPLEGLRILVTRAPEDAADLAQLLRSRGAVPVLLPTIAFGPPANLGRLDDSLRTFGTYDWIIFTSAQGVNATVQRRDGTGIRGPAGRRTRIATVGPATTKAAIEAGLRVAFEPSRYLTEALAHELPDVAGRRILLLRAEVASPDLPRVLGERGAHVDDVAAYRTYANPEASSIVHELARSESRLDWILFTSSSTVDALVSLVSPETLGRFLAVPVGVIGPVTARAASAAGFHVQANAATHTVAGLVSALEGKVNLVA